MMVGNDILTGCLDIEWLISEQCVPQIVQQTTLNQYFRRQNFQIQTGKMQAFQYFEIGSLLLSLFLIPKLRRTPFIWFIPYLIVVVLVDVLANYFPLSFHQSNQWRFNLYLPIQYFFF